MRSFTSTMSLPLRGWFFDCSCHKGILTIERPLVPIGQGSLVVKVPQYSLTRGRRRFARDYHSNEKDPQNERNSTTASSPLKALANRAYAIQKKPLNAHISAKGVLGVRSLPKLHKSQKNTQPRPTYNCWNIAQKKKGNIAP